MIDKQEEELLMTIGLALPNPPRTASRPSRPVAVGGSWNPFDTERLDPATKARRFLSARYEQLHGALCADSEKRKKILASEEATVVAVVADLISPLALGVPVMTLAALLARIGLKRLCASDPFYLDD